MTTQQENNKKANAASQTLFRFASLRNPQLAEAKNNDNFIVRDPGSKGLFDEKLVEWYALPEPRIPKIDFLVQQINSATVSELSTVAKTRRDLKKLVGAFFEAGKTLAQKGNFGSFYETLHLKAVTEGTKENLLLNPSSVGAKTLWDTLMYQTLTQNDFYLKEIVIQTLQAINFFQKYDEINLESENRKRERFKQTSSAKVVLPQYLFIDSASPDEEFGPYTVDESEIGNSYIYEYSANAPLTQAQNIETTAEELRSLEKQYRLTLAEYKLKEVSNLKNELQKLQKKYQKSFANAYSVALSHYEKSIKPAQDLYANELLAVESTFTEEMTEAQKRLALNTVAKPNIQEFEFEKEPEINLVTLKERLSNSSLFTLTSLVGTIDNMEHEEYDPNSIPLKRENAIELDNTLLVFPQDRFQTFDEIIEMLDENIEKLNSEIFDNTVVEKLQYISIGGVLIPNSPKGGVALGFLLTSKYGTASNSSNLDLNLNINTEKWKVKKATFEIHTDDNVYKNSANYSLSSNNGEIVIRDLFGSGIDYWAFLTATKFKATIDFTNGDSVSIEITEPHSENPVGGIFSVQIPEVYIGRATLSSGTGTTGSDFMPSGFGIKRLGIADYLKVEQSTHAYVEGEVANIENIMAREYREKSTRRLRRSEITETTSSDTEREQLTDTTTASRFEMQSEIAKILQESRDTQGHTSFGYQGDKIRFEIGGSYSNHRSKEDSMRQAVTQAQDVTARALDRVVTKVHQERIEKIIEEFEENNSHGFDNRKGDKHVVGVYRWIDKLMKNQVWNYGKRLMFEFAVPQPAKLHLLATESSKNKKIIEKPVDPRVSRDFPMKDYTTLGNENVLKYWSSKYNFDIDEKPKDVFWINKSFSGRDPGFSGKDNDSIQVVNGNGEIIIPEGYVATEAGYLFNTWPHGFKGIHAGFLSIAGKGSNWIVGTNDTQKEGTITDLNVKHRLEYSFATGESPIIQGTLNIKCKLTQEFENVWYQQIFNKVITAYEAALAEYNQKVAEEEAQADNIKDSNPMFYRQIEQEVLKHNCISYLTVENSKNKNLGNKMYTGSTFMNFKVDRTDIDEYTSFAKFMEQAFEWEIMSYNLYPYYWGNKEEWESMFVSENVDPLFRSFLRSGMARVVVTVRPGFEDAVQFYMSTGRLWNGGEVPVIGDPMYLSIVDELKDIKGEPQGKPWITRVPTPLTILQAKSIGLEVTNALPFTDENPEDFENPEEVITESNFFPTDEVMAPSQGKLVENIEINNDYLQLTTKDDPKQIVAQLSLDDLKVALE